MHNHIQPETFIQKLLWINELANKPVTPKHDFIIWKEEFGLSLGKLSYLSQMRENKASTPILETY